MPNPRLGHLYPSNIAEGYRSLYNSDTPFSDYAQGAKGLLSNAAENLAADNEAIQRGDVDTAMKFALPFAGGMAVKPTFTSGLPKHIEGLYPNQVAKDIGYRMMSNKGKVDPDFALRNIIRDKLGSMSMQKETNPDVIYDAFNSIRPHLGGHLEATKEYLKLLGQKSNVIKESASFPTTFNQRMGQLAEIPSKIKEQGTSITRQGVNALNNIQRAYPQIFGQGANVGNTLKKIWQTHYSDMKFSDMVQKLKAKADSIVNNPAEAEENSFGKRNDGTLKQNGFLGVLSMTDGSNKKATEMSMGINLDGKETEIPMLVPTLSKQEVDHLLLGNEATSQIRQKAIDHAIKRMRQGQSPFANNTEKPSEAKEK